MIVNISLSSSSVELHDDKENIKKLNTLKQEVLLLEDNSCSNVVNELIKYYEKTSYDGMVNLKELYDSKIDNSGFLGYYTDLKDSCNLTEEDNDKYSFSDLFITTTIQNEEIYQRYLYQYELGVKDLYFRSVVEPNLNNTEYRIRKKSELKIISNVIEMVKERGV